MSNHNETGAETGAPAGLQYDITISHPDVRNLRTPRDSTWTCVVLGQVAAGSALEEAGYRVVIGDSKEGPTGRMLGFDTEEITTFFGAIKDGDFDYLLGSAPQPDVQ